MEDVNKNSPIIEVLCHLVRLIVNMKPCYRDHSTAKGNLSRNKPNAFYPSITYYHFIHLISMLTLAFLIVLNIKQKEFSYPTGAWLVCVPF